MLLLEILGSTKWSRFHLGTNSCLSNIMMNISEFCVLFLMCNQTIIQKDYWCESSQWCTKILCEHTSAWRQHRRGVRWVKQRVMRLLRGLIRSLYCDLGNMGHIVELCSKFSILFILIHSNWSGQIDDFPSLCIVHQRHYNTPHHTTTH